MTKKVAPTKRCAVCECGDIPASLKKCPNCDSPRDPVVLAKIQKRQHQPYQKLFKEISSLVLRSTGVRLPENRLTITCGDFELSLSSDGDYSMTGGSFITGGSLITPAGKKRIAAAQRARWAKIRSKKVK